MRNPVSYRDLEEIMAERGVDIDHATLNRWVVGFSPLLADQAKLRKRPASSSWRMDETYIKAFPFIHEAYPAALKKFQHSSGVKRSQISPMASMS